MEFASQIPVVEGGPAERGEPHELVPGVGELEAIPEPTEREGGSRNREKNQKKGPETRVPGPGRVVPCGPA